jgi:hypothetical protein
MRIEPVRGAPGVPGLGAMLAAVTALAAVLAAGWTGAGFPGPACPFRAWTGWPCLGCGSTRMLVALVHGEPAVALARNPLAFVGLVAVMGWGVVSAIGLAIDVPRYRVALGARETIAVRVLAVGAIIAGWAYLVRHGA